MEIINAVVGDIAEILEIYEHARAFMQANGNANQWTGGYPQRELLEGDIAEKSLYLIKDGAETLGVFKFLIGADPTYAVIENGSWLNDAPYGVIHRLAVAKRGGGVAGACIEWCCKQCADIRADTHQNNLPMQRLLEKQGFVKCGIIYLENGDPRIAYHLTQKENV